MLTFKRVTDEDSGMDLYTSYGSNGAILEKDLDHWTVTRIMKYLDISNVIYKEEEE